MQPENPTPEIRESFGLKTLRFLTVMSLIFVVQGVLFLLGVPIVVASILALAFGFFLNSVLWALNVVYAAPKK